MSSAPRPLRVLARAHARARRTALAAAVLAIAALLAAPGAQAALPNGLTLDPDYAHADLASCQWLGQSDQNGVYYATTCNGRVLRYDRYGRRLADIVLPTNINQPRDVAPSPDGRYLYITQGNRAPLRLNRKADGTYALDTAWKLAQFSFWNIDWAPLGHAIATDGRGDIYLSNGSYWASQGTQTSIVKYHADGSFVTAFGDYGPEPGNWIVNMDLAVSRDGRRVFVGENCGTACEYDDPDYSASRVTRYDFTPGGTYRFTHIVTAQGPMDGNPFPRCESEGATHSAYSVTLDFDENLYVTSTTCGRIQMFATGEDPADDRFLKSVAVWIDPNVDGYLKGFKNHYLSADWAGRLYAKEWSSRLTPSDVRVPDVPLPPLEPLPEPDVTAPTVAQLTLPAVTTTQEIEVRIDAADDMAVAELQLAREDGEWGPWQPFASSVSYSLTDGYGTKGVYVRVRDMAGNESNTVYRTLSFVEPVGDDPDAPPPPVADAADPVLTRVSVPALTPTADIQVVVEATDDTGVRAIRLANEDGNWQPWQEFADVVDWTLSAGTGPKAVYVQVRDGAGRESNVILERSSVQADAPPPPPPGEEPAEPDMTAPVLASIDVPAETTKQDVTITLDATDDIGISQVRFANEDGNWAAWTAWNAQQQWKLSDGFGLKLVYAQVRDAVGNESLVLTARSTFVATAAGPVDALDPSLVSITMPATVPTGQVTVQLDATDDIGVRQVRLANEDGNWGAWQDFAAEVPHQLTAGNTYKVVYAQVRDAVGRESNVLFARTQVTG